MINSPLSLPCGAILNNRLAKAALTERLAQPNRLPNSDHLALYEHWAKNGSGLMLSGNILVDKRYLESTGNVVIEKGTDIEPFQKWTAKVLGHGNHFWAQLSHAGRQASKFSTLQPVSSSEVKLNKMGLFGKPKALTESGIQDVINRFIHAAIFCKEAGFTGVQFHGAHGYLISQFLSPITNQRNDKWGGSIDNRSRLLFTIIEKARKALGPAFPIAVKLNSADFMKGGFNETDSKYVIKGLEERGLDLVEISGGTYEQTALFGYGLKASTQRREAYFIDFAKEMKADCNIPLMVTGGFRSLRFCNEVLENGELDIIGFGRPYLLDEDFPRCFLDGSKQAIADPSFPVLDKNNADNAEAGFYDLQIKRLAAGKGLNHRYSGLKLATHIGWVELKKGLANRLYSQK